MESTLQIKADEVILVIPQNPEGYVVYTLQEASEPAYHLSKTYTPKLSADLTRYLVDPSRLPAHLSVDLHVVVSTRSGTGQAQAFYDAVLEPLLSALGLHREDPSGSSSNGGAKRYYLVVTSHSGSVQEFARSTLSSPQQPTSVILLSGDGGVVDLLNCGPGSSGKSPAASPPVVALLPLGTGNALFHSIHRPLYDHASSMEEGSLGPHHLVLALRTLFAGTPHGLPAFRASFSRGAKLVSTPSKDIPSSEQASSDFSSADQQPLRPVPNSSLVGTIVCSYGFHASLVYESDTPSLRKFGNKRFGMAAAELLKTAHAYDATVEYCVGKDNGSSQGKDEEQQLEWEHIKRQKHGYVLAAHVSNMEKTFCISPSSKPLDGRLWLVHFAPLQGEEVMKIMYAAYSAGSHVGMEEVGYLSVDRLKVWVREWDPRWRKVCIDGTIVELEEDGWMEVSRGHDSGLRVLVPGIEVCQCDDQSSASSRL